MSDTKQRLKALVEPEDLSAMQWPRFGQDRVWGAKKKREYLQFLLLIMYARVGAYTLPPVATVSNMASVSECNSGSSRTRPEFHVQVYECYS